MRALVWFASTCLCICAQPGPRIDLGHAKAKNQVALCTVSVNLSVSDGLDGFSLT
jgi:hypothetical protein